MNSTSFLLYLTHPYMSIFMCKYILHVTFLKAYINPNVSIVEVKRKNNILRIILRAQNGKLRKVPINCNSTKSIICVNNIYEYELLFAILMRQQKINNNKENLILYIKDIVQYIIGFVQSTHCLARKCTQTTYADFINCVPYKSLMMTGYIIL